MIYPEVNEWWEHLVYGTVWIKEERKDCNNRPYYLCQKPDGSEAIAFEPTNNPIYGNRWLKNITLPS